MFWDLFDVESRKVKENIKDSDPYNDEFYDARKQELKQRVDEKRYKHTMGVVKMATKLAKEYHVDKSKARLAALLHDWDKCYDDEQMRERINTLGINEQTTQYVIDNMPKILHGTTAAFALGIKYPQIPTDVLRAIMVHTTGETHMSALDMIIYIADALEPSRDYKGYEKLVDLIGKDSLQDLFTKVYAECTIAVLKKGKVLHPASIDVWNHHILKYRQRHDNK